MRKFGSKCNTIYAFNYSGVKIMNCFWYQFVSYVISLTKRSLFIYLRFIYVRGEQTAKVICCVYLGDWLLNKIKLNLILLKGLPGQPFPFHFRLPGIFELVLCNFAALDLPVYWHAPHTSITEWQTAKHLTWRADWQTRCCAASFRFFFQSDMQLKCNFGPHFWRFLSTNILYSIQTFVKPFRQICDVYVEACQWFSICQIDSISLLCDFLAVFLFST